ncbi:hypothetical protein GCM10009075_22920 [Sphingomonas trueperi]
MFVGKQFQPVVERTHGAQQVVAQARTKQTREFGRADIQVLRLQLWIPFGAADGKLQASWRHPHAIGGVRRTTRGALQSRYKAPKVLRLLAG